MPPSLNEYLPLLQPDNSLIWPHFSSSILYRFIFDGGVFGVSAITFHHISMLSEMPNLEELILKYCLDDLHPTSFSSLANLEVKWKSLEFLEIRYKFGDPNWEREELDRLVQPLQSSMSKDPGPHSQPGHTFFRMERKEVEGYGRSCKVKILEGGDESDDD
jgi:hypothetical protein